MMDTITGRAPPPARAESYRSKGSRELARPGPSLVLVVDLPRPIPLYKGCTKRAGLHALSLTVHHAMPSL